MWRVSKAGSSPDAAPRPHSAREVFLVFLLFATVAWSIPPDVNEAHYLSKARHLWDPSWCAGDSFLESTGAHGTFFVAFGWLTTLVSFSIAAWVGRLVTWFFLAWSWQRLCSSFLQIRWASLVAAGLFAALLEWGPMAGEWVLGGLESKGLAYALVFFALAALARGKWNHVWPLLGCAASMHVLVGGWSVVAAFIAWMLSAGERPQLRHMLPALLLGFLLSLPGLLPAIAMNTGVDAESVRVANRAYVFERLSHHLVFSSLPPVFIARHVGLIAMTVLVASRCSWQESQLRLLRFVLAAVGIGVAGVLIELIARHDTDLAASLLRFYWFRLSDVAVPLGAALCWITYQRQQTTRRPVFARVLLVAAIGLGGACVGHALWQSSTDLRPPAIIQGMPSGESRSAAIRRYRQWRAACEWINENCEQGAIVLTPRYQQTMKWYAQRGEVANWKDIPQSALGIVAWRKRMEEFYPRDLAWKGLVSHGEARLQELAAEYGFTYILLDRTRSKRPLQFQRVYPTNSQQVDYEVYRLPKESRP